MCYLPDAIANPTGMRTSATLQLQDLAHDREVGGGLLRRALTAMRLGCRPVQALAAALVLVFGGCATPPKDLRVDKVDLAAGYRLETALERVGRRDPETLLLVAFSGGGTRAAAFSFGVLEALRDTPVESKAGGERMLDRVDAISGVSGGSFTALAYGILGDRVFDEFPRRFLLRDVQGALVKQALDPLHWPTLLAGQTTRSDLAADYYDRVLFEEATFGDLARRDGPMVIVSATNFASGSLFTFTQGTFDFICADLSRMRLSVAATASSAVPIVFAPVTLRNWGGTCALPLPDWVTRPEQLGPAASLSLQQRLGTLLALQDSARQPWLHLVDGGVSDNLGLRTFLDLLEAIAARKDLRSELGLGRLRRVAVVVVNALSVSQPDWGRSPGGPGLVATILQSASVPIDRNSLDTIVFMQAMVETWKLRREIDVLKERAQGRDAELPPIEFYPIVLSFDNVPSSEDRAYFNELPTTFSLPEETVDRLRAVGRTLLQSNHQFQAFQRSLQDAR
jgi:NTE family protein